MSDDHGDVDAAIRLGREMEREQCIKDVCGYCADGVPIERKVDGSYMHNVAKPGTWLDEWHWCDADPIRRRVEGGE